MYVSRFLKSIWLARQKHSEPVANLLALSLSCVRQVCQPEKVANLLQTPTNLSETCPLARASGRDNIMDFGHYFFVSTVIVKLRMCSLKLYDHAQVNMLLSYRRTSYLWTCSVFKTYGHDFPPILTPHLTTDRDTFISLRCVILSIRVRVVSK